MSIPRRRTCVECGSLMELKRTRIRRTKEGFELTTVWWTCGCGTAAHQSHLDPDYKGMELPRGRSQNAHRRSEGARMQKSTPGAHEGFSLSAVIPDRHEDHGDSFLRVITIP